VTEVAPGILRLQMPIQMPGLGHVNCYALEDERGFTVVDPGMPGKKSWEAMLGRFDAAGFKLKNIHTVVVTHSHVDHFGASGRIRVETGAKVVTADNFSTWWDPYDSGEQELELADGTPKKSAKRGRPWDQQTPWGGQHPRPPLRVRVRYTVLRPFLKQWFVTPQPSVRLADAETVTFGRREWVSVHTPGHTPDHVCLYDSAGGVLLSGDHVLPTITPHISGVDAGPDPLSAFFSSLDKVAELDGVGCVLPAHGHPFTDLRTRVKDIHRHHEERLARLKEANEALGEATVEDLSKQLFRERSWGPMAESETYAHLEHLRLGGEATRREEAGHLLYSVQ
jgi:glyoxylase-like metal-dependent hydrolase (beta-lactamase superfamily II)